LAEFFKKILGVKGMGFDLGLAVDSFPLLLAGAVVTVQITLLSVGVGMLIGLFVGIARLSSFWPVKALAAVYVDFLRGTPLLVQIFLIYFALPMMTGSRVDPFFAAIAACGINSGAYVAEIFRAGIQSIDKGQMEAGRSLGMSWWQTMRYIIIPQAFKRVIPPLGNEFIAMLKDSSLVSVIGFEELTRCGQLVIARTYGSLEIWTSVAIIYLAMTISISRLVAYLERRYDVK
jgi:polar amino acid transport system permease protein